MLKNSLIASLIVFVLVLAGCSTSNDNGGTSSKGKDDRIELDIFQFKVEFKKQFEDVAKKYEKEHPDVKINIGTVGGGNDYAGALKAKFSSGNEPAIFNIGGPADIEEYKDRLTDLSKTKSAEEALQSTLESVTVDGEVYGLPYNQEGYGFVYNTEIFKEAGVDASSIQTMDDLAAAVEKIDSKKDELNLDAVFAMAGKELWTEGQHGANLFIASDFNGSALEAFDAKELPFTKAAQFKDYIDLQNKYSVQPVVSLDYSKQVEELFSTGRVAMVQQGNWIYPTIEQMDPELAKNVDLLPIPVDGEMKIPVGVANYWAVNAKVSEEQQEAAREFLDWLYTSDEGKEIVLNDFKFIPAYEGYDTEKISDPLSKKVYEYAKDGKTIGWAFKGFPTGWTDVMGANLQKYLAGEATWDEAIDASKEKWAELRK